MGTQSDVLEGQHGRQTLDPRARIRTPALAHAICISVAPFVPQSPHLRDGEQSPSQVVVKTSERLGTTWTSTAYDKGRILVGAVC